MEVKLKLFLICLCLIFDLFIYKKVEKGNLLLKYSFPWYIVTFLLILITVFDGILVPIRDFLGFEKTSNMIFLFGFSVLVMIIFSLNLKISEYGNKITKLTQEVGLLKKEVERHEGNKKSNKKI